MPDNRLLCNSERLILDHIRRGREVSLYRLALELEISYPHAWQCLKRLEATGLVRVARQPGRPLEMTSQ